MIVAYPEISDLAKVFIYPSSRKFYTTEVGELIEKIQLFLKNWSEENTQNIAYQFLYNRFLVFFVDDQENPLKNNEIDAIVTFIFQLENDYSISLLDKMNVCFKQGEYVQYKELKDFKGLLKNKALTEKSIVFDNLVTTKGDFENNWETSIADSWYNRFLKKK
jgi:hypothetical protein